jgi:hypothetical protein
VAGQISPSNFSNWSCSIEAKSLALVLILIPEQAAQSEAFEARRLLRALDYRRFEGN